MLNGQTEATEKSGGGVKHGCAVFLIMLLVFAAGAGVSVLLKGKSMKPKSRALVVAKPQARLDEITAKLAPDMPADVKDNFLAAFQQYADALVKYGSQSFDKLGPVGDSLEQIESDGVITPDEAKQWTETEKKTLSAVSE